MANDITNISPAGPYLESQSGLRFIPEPKTSSGFSLLKGALQGAAGIAGAVASRASSLASLAPQIDSEYQSLITLQLEAQKQMMLVSMVSNIEKSKHETQMSAVRNIRVG